MKKILLFTFLCFAISSAAQKGNGTFEITNVERDIIQFKLLKETYLYSVTKRTKDNKNVYVYRVETNYKKFGNILPSATLNTANAFCQCHFMPDELEFNIKSDGSETMYYNVVDGKWQSQSSVSNDVIEDILLNIYPNPASNNLTIEGAQIGETAHIYSLTGSLITTCKIATCKQNLDITNLHSGIYFIRIGEKSMKLVKK